MAVVEFFLLFLALVGSLALWVKVFNNAHARSLPCWAVRSVSAVCYLCIVTSPIILAYWYMASASKLIDQLRSGQITAPLLYVIVCWLMAIWVGISVLRRCVSGQTANPVLSNHTEYLNVLSELGDAYDGPRWATMLSRLPGNELLHLAIQEKHIRLKRMPAILEGLSIAHLSDLHFTGKVGKAYFEEVIRRANAMGTDLIAVTGDIIDNPACLDWIPDTLGKLSAPHGVYFVLGNHDVRNCPKKLRQKLVELDLIDLGGHHTIVKIRGCEVVLAGNELPWFVPAADLQSCPRSAVEPSLRIALSHSPDQFDWAKRWDIDLMLAGHTHGGQIRFPLLGPIVAPSREGTRYASGTFEDPPTVMHVSRGLSGTFPVRHNCPPELTKIILTQNVEGSPSE